jgi:hypothetical protein
MTGAIDMGTQDVTNVGLVDGVDVAALKTQSDTNVTGIATNVTDIGLRFLASDVDVDGTLTADSDTKVPSQKAIKTYVDAQVLASGSGDFKADGTVAMTGAIDFDVDTNLFRSAANVLRTDDEFQAANLVIDGSLRSTNATFNIRTGYSGVFRFNPYGGSWQPSVGDKAYHSIVTNSIMVNPSYNYALSKHTGKFIPVSGANIFTKSWTGLHLDTNFGNGANSTYNGVDSLSPLRITSTIDVNGASTKGYSGFFMDITETSIASGASNKLLDLNVNGANQFSVDNLGKVTATEFHGDGSNLTGVTADTFTSLGTLNLTADTDNNSTGGINFSTGGNSKMMLTNSGNLGIGTETASSLLTTENILSSAGQQIEQNVTMSQTSGDTYAQKISVTDTKTGGSSYGLFVDNTLGSTYVDRVGVEARSKTTDSWGTTIGKLATNEYGVFASNNRGTALYVESVHAYSGKGIYLDSPGTGAHFEIGGGTGSSGRYGLSINTDDTPLHVDNSLLYLSHDTSVYNSSVFSANMAKGSGTFTGKFIDFQKNSVSQFSIDNTGRTIASVFVGDEVQVNKELITHANDAVASTAIDFDSGNIQYTSADCGSFSLEGLNDGTSYTLIVQGTNVQTCSFSTINSNSGDTVKLPPGHGPTIAGKHTIYTFIKAGNYIYAAYIPGY